MSHPLKKQLLEEERTFRPIIMPIPFLAFIIAQVVYMGYEIYAWHISIPAYTMDCSLSILYTALGFTSAPFWQVKSEFDKEGDNTKVKFIVYLVVGGVIAFFIDAAAGTISKYIKFDVSGIELFLYFAVDPVGEEDLFRLALITWIIRIGLHYYPRSKGSLKLIAVIATGILFGLFHIGVYGNDPILIAGIAGVGIVLGFIFVQTRNILVTITIHVIINIIVSFALLHIVL